MSTSEYNEELHILYRSPSTVG